MLTVETIRKVRLSVHRDGKSIRHEVFSGDRHESSRNRHTSYLDTQTIHFRNDISVPQFQNNPFLQNAYQLFAAVLHGLCVRPDPSETGHFGIPGFIVQLLYSAFSMAFWQYSKIIRSLLRETRFFP